MNIIVKKEMIFTVRPTNNCHASTLLKLGNSLLCAWFGGSREGNNDVNIWLSIKKEGLWCTPKIISTDKMITDWNPVLFSPDDKTVILYYKSGLTIADWKTMTAYSYDGGITFTASTELVPGDKSGGRGPVKNKPIKISSGRILCPGSTERGQWKAFIDYSDDGGKTFTKSHDIVVPDVNIIQPTLWQDDKEKVHMLLRSNAGVIYKSDSNDHGKNWYVPYPTAIPHNNSGIDCVKLNDGRVLLVCNPVKKGRNELSLMLSEDNGETFNDILSLEKEESGEFSYPAIIADANKVYISYTWNRTHIAFWELEI